MQQKLFSLFFVTHISFCLSMNNFTMLEPETQSQDQGSGKCQYLRGELAFTKPIFQTSLQLAVTNAFFPFHQPNAVGFSNLVSHMFR